MKRNLWLFAFGLAIAGLFVLLQLVFIVRQGEVRIVTLLGKPVRAVAEPGLYFRWPWPVMDVHAFDNRLHSLEGALEETMTSEGKNVLVSVYTAWCIKDPVRFLERVGSDPRQAEDNLDGLVRSSKNAAIGRVKLAELVNTSTNQLRHDQIEAQILAAAQPQALDRYGIEIRFVGIRRVALPEAITQSVFERMRSERQRLATDYRSQGESAATVIRAQADAQRDRLLAKADADARRIRAEGDAAAAEQYKVFAKNPELATFLRKLDVMQQSLKEKSTVILGTDTEPFDLLKGALREPGPGAVEANE